MNFAPGVYSSKSPESGHPARRSPEICFGCLEPSGVSARMERIYQLLYSNNQLFCFSEIFVKARRFLFSMEFSDHVTGVLFVQCYHNLTFREQKHVETVFSSVHSYVTEMCIRDSLSCGVINTSAMIPYAFVQTIAKLYFKSI